MLSPTRSLTGVRVLIVEDEPLIALDCQMILTTLGVASATCAGDLLQAEALLAHSPPFDAAILDIALGAGGSSVLLARRLADLNIPIGFMSGYGQDRLPPGFEDCPYVGKPFSSAQLADLLARLLGRAS